MAPSTPMARSLLAIWLLPSLTVAVLQVTYPLNLQLPPVAHVDKAYQYQFAPTTFATDSDEVQYSLVGSPAWLSLDSNSRTLSGAPRISDIGEFDFKIAAAGSAGAVVNMDSKLLVSEDGGAEAKANITQVLANAGQLSGPQTITIGPSQHFDITFPFDSFGSNGTALSYYALLSDHTPLPAWISFDASTLHFAGTTPPTTSAQIIDILLIASSTSGYAASSLSFTIAISNHQLFFQPYTQILNLSKGEGVEIDIKSTLLLDGSPIQGAQIQAVDARLPPWLKLDNTTSRISGSAPPGMMSQDLKVNATDQFGDVAQLLVHINFQSALFANEIGQLNATIEESFEYMIPQGILTNENEKLSIDFSSLSRYLTFDATHTTISGKITPDFSAQKVQCTLTAVSSDGVQKDTQTFQIAVADAPDQGGAEAPAGGANTSSKHDDKSEGKTAGTIIGSIIGAICGILLLVGLALCFRRRKQRKTYMSPKLPRSPRKSDISRPMLIPLGWPDVDVDQDQDLEKGKGETDFLVGRTSDKPPKLDLDLPVDDRDSDSLTDSIGDADTRILDTFEESSWGFQNDTAPSQHPHDSMKIPTEQLSKRSSLRSDTFRRHKRRTTTVYQDQIHRSTGLPVNRRITGMGHGRQTYSPSRSNTNFSRHSLRRPSSTSSYTTRCTSTFSTAPSTVPHPPVARQQTARVTLPAEQRCSIRVVAASTRSSLADRPMVEKRHSFIRKRASAQSPFFSASGSRTSSLTYKPAFISDVPATRDTIVRPDDDVVEGRGKELPDSQTSNKPSVSPIPETPSKEFPGSLRQNRVPRPHTSAGVRRDRVEKSYARPGTAIASSSSEMGRRASTRDSLRAYELKSRLNDLTGSEIFKDAELSDSVYTDEEDEIEEAERRTTVRPGDFTLPPLQIDARRRSKRTSVEKRNEKQKKASKGETPRDLKRTSERDSTPFYTKYQSEHGGKENMSSTYSLGARSTPTRTETPRKSKTPTSPERPKTARHSRTASDARKTNRASKALSQPADQAKERHSRKSLHSRSQSRQSGPLFKKPHSRAQSTAYPYFDTASRPSSIGNAITTAADAISMPEGGRASAKSSLMTRDLSGNLTFYGAEDEEPTVEELRSSSIGLRTSNGRINSIARRSRLASLHESLQFATPSPPPKSLRRRTVVQAPAAPGPTAAKPAGLGLFPVDARAEPCASGGEREMTSLSMLPGDNRATPEMQDSELEVQKGRQTWGGLKSIVGRGSRWVSGGGYWDKQGKEERAFL